ncbi:hypothetical protein O5559_27225, partial [Escherichia coli]|nr:hypothetical protein [Escherichia coli]
GLMFGMITFQFSTFSFGMGLPLAKLEPFLKQMKAIDDLVKGFDELDTSK